MIFREVLCIKKAGMITGFWESDRRGCKAFLSLRLLVYFLETIFSALRRLFPGLQHLAVRSFKPPL